MSLDGKIAWITGAGTGIGHAGATTLARHGVHVLLSGRRLDVLESAKREFTAGGGSAEVLPLDITDSDATEHAAKEIVRDHGRIDILVNSAGINIPNRTWQDVDADGWNSVIQADLNGAFHVSRAVLPAMRAQGDGLLINIASWAGRYDTFLTGPAYNAAKHGLLAMSAHLNLEEGRNGIRACTICPGEVNTPIIDKRPIPVPQEERERMLQPRDLGDTILFVCQMHPRVCVNEILISPTWNRLSMNQTAG